MTPASPFLPHLHLHPTHPNPIPFSPSPPHTASPSPTQRAIIPAHDRATAAHPLRPQTRDLSHPSLQSSPLPSPLHSNNNNSSSRTPPHLHSTYFPFQARLPSDDHPPQHAQAPLQRPHPSTQAQNLITLGLEWSPAQTYPSYSSTSSPMDMVDATTHWETRHHTATIQTPQHPLPHPPQDTIPPHFTSNRPHPPTQQQQQHQQHHPRRPPSSLQIHANVHSRDQTAHTMMPPSPMPSPGPSTTTMAQNPDPNLGASPSWNSATTRQQRRQQPPSHRPMPDLAHFYYPAAEDQTRAQTQLAADSSRLPRPSHLSIADHPRLHYNTRTATHTNSDYKQFQEDILLETTTTEEDAYRLQAAYPPLHSHTHTHPHHPQHHPHQPPPPYYLSEAQAQAPDSPIHPHFQRHPVPRPHPHSHLTVHDPRSHLHSPAPGPGSPHDPQYRRQMPPPPPMHMLTGSLSSNNSNNSSNSNTTHSSHSTSMNTIHTNTSTLSSSSMSTPQSYRPPLLPGEGMAMADMDMAMGMGMGMGMAEEAMGIKFESQALLLE